MLYTENDHATRSTALFEAIRLCGSRKKLCLKIKITRSFLSKLLSDRSITMSYDLAFIIEKKLGIGIECLIPHKKEINAYIEERALNRFMLREISKKVIITTNSISLPFLQSNRFIIIGTDGILISGLAILNAHSGDQIKVLLLDLTLIINKVISIEDLLYKLLISERIAIGLRLEQLIGNRQGQRTTNNIINPKHNNTSYQINGRTDDYVAKIIGFSKDTYIRCKQVYLSKDQKLINAVDNKTMSIAKAAKLIRLKQQQHQKVNHNN